MTPRFCHACQHWAQGTWRKCQPLSHWTCRSQTFMASPATSSQPLPGAAVVTQLSVSALPLVKEIVAGTSCLFLRMWQWHIGFIERQCFKASFFLPLISIRCSQHVAHHYENEASLFLLFTTFRNLKTLMLPQKTSLVFFCFFKWPESSSLKLGRDWSINQRMHLSLNFHF